VNSLLTLIAHHGYLLIFLVVLAEAIGLPMPAALALVAAGAAAASHALKLPFVLLLSVMGMLIGDILLFFLGRAMGWTLLGFLCRVSINPESCILRSAESFYKRGKITLLFAKFVPGVNTMAPPLAGSMKMRLPQFLRLDFVGAALYATAYIMLGFIFRDFLATITRRIQMASHVFSEVLLIAALIYIVYRIALYQKNKIYQVVPRVQVAELAARMASDERINIIVADVRSYGYYDSNAQRIRGSIRIEPNNLAEELKNLPKDKDIYVYCT
jgi:membrane protein DedA with SNARE-associated domain